MDTVKRDERGRFGPGNTGRPKGARNRASRAVEALLDGEAEALTRCAIERALEGDTVALRLCLDRIAPAAKERAAPIALPEISSAADLPQALAALARAVAAGDLAPGQASSVAALLDTTRRAFETADLEARLSNLERRNAGASR